MRLRTILGVIAALVVLVLASPADARRGGGKGNGPRPTPAPEFDPAAAGVIASLLAGGTALLARRRRG